MTVYVTPQQLVALALQDLDHTRGGDGAAADFTEGYADMLIQSRAWERLIAGVRRLEERIATEKVFSFPENKSTREILEEELDALLLEESERALAAEQGRVTTP